MAPLSLARWSLRAALAFALLYPAIAAYFDPLSWLAYFPSFLVAAEPSATGFINFSFSEIALLHIFGAAEIALAMWILSGWRADIPAALTAALLTAIVLFNLPQLSVLFRDISLALAAVALVFIERAPQQPRLSSDAPEAGTAAR